MTNSSADDTERLLEEHEVLVRSLGYLLVSAGCVVFGALQGELSPWNPSGVMLLAFLFSTVPLNVAYTSCFEFDAQGSRRAGPFINAIIVAAPVEVVVVLASVLWAASGSGVSVGQAWSEVKGFLSPLGLAIVVSVAYGYFLVQNFSSGSAPEATVRHQLVWPIIGGAAIPAYFAWNMRGLSQGAISLAPVGLLLLVAVASHFVLRTPRTFFVVLVFIWVAGFLVTLEWGLWHDLYKLLVCIAICGYLAVFEAWRLTSYLDRKVAVQKSRISQYHEAALGALIASGLAFPALYLSGSLDCLGLCLIGVHFLAAVAIWRTAISDGGTLRRRKWNSLKLLFGFSFMVFLVGDRVLGANALPKLPINIEIAAGVVGAALVAVLVYLFTTRPDGGLSVKVKYSALLLLLSALAAVAVAVYKGSDDVRQSYAFAMYCCYFLAAMVFLFWPEVKELWRNPKTRETLAALAILVRWRTSLLIGLMCLGGLATKGLLQVSGLIASLAFSTAAAGGFAINDLLDVRRDEVNQPSRPLASGRLERLTALRAAISLTTASTILGAVVYVLNKRWEPIVALVIVLVYGEVVRVLAAAKGVLTAFACALPVIYISSSEESSHGTWIFAAAVLAFVAGRELLMDVLDLPGDTRFGVRTLPSRLGIRGAERIAMVAHCSSFLLLIRFSYLQLGRLGVVAAVLVFLLGVSQWLRWGTGCVPTRRGVIADMWYTMAAGSVLFVL